MDTRIFHGKIQPNDLAQALAGAFNRGNLRSQAFGDGRRVVVQIGTRDRPPSGGQTGLTVTIDQAPDGVLVNVGKQAWYGIAASLGQTAFSVWRNPWRILDRLDDLAQDFESLQLTESIWQVVEATARARGAAFELSERLRRLMCEYCLAANPVGEPTCLMCGAPLGRVQPRTCRNCGYVLKRNEGYCPNCGQKAS
jgi:hypothetical protein